MTKRTHIRGGEVRFEGPAAELLERPDILRAVFIAGASSQENASASAPAAATKPRRMTAKAKAAEAVASEPTRPPIDPDAKPVLACDEVVKRFGGITAVDHVDLHVQPGEIVGLIGHNGAGKTTLMDCISGFLSLDGGRIRLRGVDITDWPPHLRAKGAMARSFQDALLYPSLTVCETI